MKAILEYIINNHVSNKINTHVEHLYGKHFFAGKFQGEVFHMGGDDWLKIYVKLNNEITLNLFYTKESSWVYYLNPKYPDSWAAFSNESEEMIDEICEKPEDFYEIINTRHDLATIPEFENIKQNLLENK